MALPVVFVIAMVKRTEGPAISPGPFAVPCTASTFVTLAVRAFTIVVGAEMAAVFVGCGVGADATADGLVDADGVAEGLEATGLAVGSADADAEAEVDGEPPAAWRRGPPAAETTPITTMT